jgi:hypothetical protein
MWANRLQDIPIPMERYYSIGQAARLLGVSVKTLPIGSV